MSVKRNHTSDKYINSEDKVKRKKSENVNIQITQTLMLKSVKENIKKAFLHKDVYLEDNHGVKISQEPFCHVVVPNFLQEINFLTELERELSGLSFLEKNNDLYKFHQSNDLKGYDTPHIKALKSLLQGEFRSWLSEITGIDLTENVDLFCSKYDYTDVLLCHDDELESRRVAYILYLVPDSWLQEDGGTLDLFDMDEKGQPHKVVKSICPQRNTLAFFEVTEKSFHQVAEVLSKDKTRLTVTGWYHSSPLPRPPAFTEPAAILTQCVPLEEDELYAWINPVYLNPVTQAEIKETFETDSEIQLQDFLQADKYSELLLALQSNQTKWEHRGPPHKRNYHRCEKADQPIIVQDCIKFFQSDAMFLILSNLTGLKLHELAAVSDSESEQEAESSNVVKENVTENKGEDSTTPRCCSEVRRWSHGSYTLVNDTDRDVSQVALDAVLSIGSKDWQPSHGGYTSYIAKGEDEELLTVHPVENSLSLVYRDVNTLRFVKHVNHTILDKNNNSFYDIASVYFE